MRLQDETLYVAEGDHEAPCQVISERYFRSDLGVFEFVETPDKKGNVLVWGRAVRYYPVDRQQYDERRVIRYLTEVPTVAHRVG